MTYRGSAIPTAHGIHEAGHDAVVQRLGTGCKREIGSSYLDLGSCLRLKGGGALLLLPPPWPRESVWLWYPSLHG